ncbi:unnamed protein product [Effrenium voratum]|uniref:Uncharacterized protein n=1 Tax=Effrenium voratum TaxID=2562239 RepID=A0AA36N389_9DINO|nr:unnamed protein product [Effrenium voratum]
MEHFVPCQPRASVQASQGAAAKPAGVPRPSRAGLLSQGWPGLLPLTRRLVRRRAGEGKFYQLAGDASSELVPAAFGPPGVVVGGWTDTELEEFVGPLLEETAAEPGMPVRVLSEEDMDRSLEEVLSSLPEMDSVLPEMGAEARLARPVVLFSGWPPEPMLKAVRQLRGLAAQKALRESMSAMAVPRAMSKSLRQLVEEIKGDFELNQGEESNICSPP